MKVCPVCQHSYPDDYWTCPRDQAVLQGETAKIAAGSVLRNKYEVLEELGSGGMATVYKVRHKAFHDLAAVKVVHPKLLADAAFLKRFRNEAVVARQLKHANAVRIDDFDYTEDGRPFIVMEYVEGSSLYNVRQQRPEPWPVALCVRIVSQAAEALSAAHALGIVHRDIKPSNILLTPALSDEIQVKILDFGIAKVAEGSFAGITSVQTQTGLVIGTPEYMSPEQASGCAESSLDGRADLYSLGLVFYEMLTGRHPFQADTPMGMLLHQIHTQPQPPSSVTGSAPLHISAVVLKMLQKDPGSRFQSATELLAALKEPEAITQPEAPRLHFDPTKAISPAPATEASPSPSKPPVMASPSAETTPAQKAGFFGKPVYWAASLAAILVVGIVGLLVGHRKAPPEPRKVSQAPAAASTASPTAGAAWQASGATDVVSSLPPEKLLQVQKLIAAGNQALRTGDNDIATEFFEQALSIDPSNADAQKGLHAAKQGATTAPQ